MAVGVLRNLFQSEILNLHSQQFVWPKSEKQTSIETVFLNIALTPLHRPLRENHW